MLIGYPPLLNDPTSDYAVFFVKRLPEREQVGVSCVALFKNNMLFRPILGIHTQLSLKCNVTLYSSLLSLVSK